MSTLGGVRIGLVSDTHGLFDPKLEGLFTGCRLILHAGDVVRPAVLDALARLAPVHAVRGNNDLAPPLDALPDTVLVPLGALRALVIHDVGTRGRPYPYLRRALLLQRPQILVHGHSHRPNRDLLDGVLYVNPGSAGPRRFSLPRTAAILEIKGRDARIDTFDLGGDALAPFGDPFEVRL